MSIEKNNHQENVFAAIDLGSNSFHLTLAKFEHQNIHTIGTLKTRVQLAAGLNRYNKLEKESMDRAFVCLKEFGQRLEGMSPHNVKALATHTLRKARNAKKFLIQAERVLGFPIEVISGEEEARLIYNGVMHYETTQKKLLVIDIGGGSTEFATGTSFTLELLNSLQMGCVSYSEKFFKHGEIKKSYFKKAITATQLELLAIEDLYLRDDWDEVVGSSGTIEAIQLLLKDRKLIDNTITYPALKLLQKEFVNSGNAEGLKLPEAIQNRREVIASGLAILIGIFKSLKIVQMRASPAAMREGILLELFGATQNEDIRENSILGLREKFHIDTDQARRVYKTAKKIYRMVKTDWAIEKKGLKKLLRWCCYIHEIGLSLNYSNYQKHGEYIIGAMDITGFSVQKKNQLALLVRSCRRKFPKELFTEIESQTNTEDLIRLARILRLAILLNHQRRDGCTLPQKIKVDKNSMELYFDEGILHRKPLLKADLEQECGFLKRKQLQLKYL